MELLNLTDDEIEALSERLALHVPDWICNEISLDEVIAIAELKPIVETCDWFRLDVIEPLFVNHGKAMLLFCSLIGIATLHYDHIKRDSQSIYYYYIIAIQGWCGAMYVNLSRYLEKLRSKKA